MKIINFSLFVIMVSFVLFTSLVKAETVKVQNSSEEPEQFELVITIEGTWRGIILDSVIPVLTAELVKGNKGYKAPNIEKKIKLANGETVRVWCIYKKSGEFNLYVFDKDSKALFSLRTKGLFYSEVYLPDGKQYQFKVREVKT